MKAICVGLGLFGVVIGMVSGLSLSSGTATSLLSGLFSFVGGVVLAYSGFRRKVVKVEGQPAVEDAPDLQRVGLGLSFVSLGVIVGIVAGMWVRYDDPFG